jgi:hypothetical protein
MTAARHDPRLLRCIVPLLGLLALPAFASTGSWDAVPSQDLKAGRAQVDSTADAEALFWKIRVEDGWDGTALYSDLSQHVRIQVFNERGAEARRTIAIPYESKSKILDLEARVIRPDGTTQDVTRKSVFERMLLKTGRHKWKQKSFAFADLKPGSILEYRWTERRYDRLSNYMRLDIQRDFPIRRLELRIKPLDIPQIDFRISSFHGPTPVFQDRPGGVHEAVLTNIAAFHAEPRMPPENAVRHWILLRYAGSEPPPTEAWKRFGKALEETLREACAADASVKKAAREAVGDAKDDPEKIRRLAGFCRTKIRNLEEDALGTPPLPENLDDNQRPADTLRRGMGTSFDVQALLVAMASAVGIQSRLAFLPDPDTGAFDPDTYAPYFMTETCVAVWLDGAWTFMNPGERYTRNAGLPASQEGSNALLADAENPTFVATPIAPPVASEGRRRGAFRLTEDGTLEGDVRVQYSGHWGEQMKEDSDQDSPEQREKECRADLRGRMSTAEVSALQFDHTLDMEPYTISYHLRVPDYATRVGKRLIFDPAVFESGRAPEFPASRRQYPVSFPYSWTEDDSVVIQLPSGFAAEGLPLLEPLSLPNLGGYDGLLATSLDGSTLVFRRRFEFGRNGQLYFPPSEYPRLKEAFETVAERDAMSISLTASPMASH